MPRTVPIFCLLLGVSSDYAQPITGQVTEVTCPVIGRAQPELTPRQKTGPGHVIDNTMPAFIIDESTCSRLVKALKYSICLIRYFNSLGRIFMGTNYTNGMIINAK